MYNLKKKTIGVELLETFEIMLLTPLFKETLSPIMIFLAHLVL